MEPPKAIQTFVKISIFSLSLLFLRSYCDKKLLFVCFAGRGKRSSLDLRSDLGQRSRCAGKVVTG